MPPIKIKTTVFLPSIEMPSVSIGNKYFANVMLNKQNNLFADTSIQNKIGFI